MIICKSRHVAASDSIFYWRLSNIPVCVCMYVYVCAKWLQLCLTVCSPMDCRPPGPLSMGFSRQEHWSGLPCSPPGDLPDWDLWCQLIGILRFQLSITSCGSQSQPAACLQPRWVSVFSFTWCSPLCLVSHFLQSASFQAIQDLRTLIILFTIFMLLWSRFLVPTYCYYTS